ncbi:MAG TPA: IS110 family transposase [Ktedonobacterales bacterium]|nr:IS110 family transposase [Ktedonobacterales bacterium]
MEMLYQRCCGLDVHKRTVVACLLTTASDGTVNKQVRTFGTMTADLLALAEWLDAAACTHIAMESTGVFWKPIYNLLEGLFELVVVNAQHMKAVPGRKTDVRDAEWIADLLRHGLLRPSFIPARPQRELRELTRYRMVLVRERAEEINRLQKVLEGANIKLAAVATDILGKSGREMLRALVGGATDAAALAELARGRMREKIPQLEQALSGHFAAHQQFLVAQQLAHIEGLEALIERVSQEITARLAAEEEAIQILQTIPGVGRRIAEILVAEVGTNLTRFKSAAHLASWAGVCPGNDESAGKRRSGKTRKGSPWLRTALVEAAQAAGRTKETYLAAQYRRLTARRGVKRAAVAVAHTILVIVYHLLTRHEAYRELGMTYFDERDRQRVERRLVHRLEALGYVVALHPAASGA